MKVLEVFLKFLVLGCMSFGGPVAHLGYFRKEFVERRAWLSEADFLNTVALSQVLPGPGSSQVGFAIGIKKAGWLGGLAAFLGFTLPSFIIMFFIARLGATSGIDNSWAGVLLGMKLLAVVVVADACLGMFASFCKNTFTRSVCVLSAVILLVAPSAATQLAVLLLAGAAAYWIMDKASVGSDRPDFDMPKKWPVGHTLATSIFVIILIAAFWQSGIFFDFYRAGALVFGGGHVVLPLLQEILSGQLSQDEFLLGYASAQAIPGPMFTFATYLGAQLFVASPLLGASVATAAIFLPGLLLMAIFLGHWEFLSNNRVFSRVFVGVNAAVVGILISALYQPVFISAVDGSLKMAAVILGIWMLRSLKLPVIYLVILMVLLGFGIDRF